MDKPDTNMFDSEAVKKQMKGEFDGYAARGFKLIHTEPSRSAIIKQVSDSSNKLDSISTATLMIINKIDSVTREASTEIHDGIKLACANLFIGDIATISKIPIKENEYKTILALTVQKYLKAEVDAGRIDPNVVSQQLSEVASKMSPEESEETDRHLSEINETAMASDAQPKNASMMAGGM